MQSHRLLDYVSPFTDVCFLWVANVTLTGVHWCPISVFSPLCIVTLAWALAQASALAILQRKGRQTAGLRLANRGVLVIFSLLVALPRHPAATPASGVTG